MVLPVGISHAARSRNTRFAILLFSYCERLFGLPRPSEGTFQIMELQNCAP